MDPSTPQAGRALLTFKNESSESFGLERVIIGLDALALCWRTMPPNRGTGYLVADDFPAISLPLLEGEHTLSIFVQLRGKLLDGVDISGYRFKVQSKYELHVDRAKLTELATVVYEQRADDMPLMTLPGVRYEERQGGAVVGPGQSGTAP